jgi:chromosome segregation ATPase
MNHLPSRGPIRPKISTMPRPQSEASLQLDIYKLVMEKQRIQAELRLIEQREKQLKQRLNVVENTIADTEKKVQDFRSLNNGDQDKLRTRSPAFPQAKSLKTFYLEY